MPNDSFLRRGINQRKVNAARCGNEVIFNGDEAIEEARGTANAREVFPRGYEAIRGISCCSCHSTCVRRFFTPGLLTEVIFRFPVANP